MLKKSESNESNTTLFKKGYIPVRKKMESRSIYLTSCYNCEYYYQAVGDKEEMCQNPKVLQYDMVVTESNIYCNLWESVKHKNQSVKTIFKSGGKKLG